MSVVLWFTGLSGSGKTTLAKALEADLLRRGKKVLMLDGDEVRKKHTRQLGFSREDIRENNRIIAEYVKEKSPMYDMVLVPVISPYREDRAMARDIIGDNFLEVFIDCPISVCEGRDVKGLYKKARKGEIQNFIGIHDSSPYEMPINPEIKIKTFKTHPEKSLEIFLDLLHKRELL